MGCPRKLSAPHHFFKAAVGIVNYGCVEMLMVRKFEASPVLEKKGEPN